MGLSYRGAGVDVSGIKKSHGAMAKILGSTHGKSVMHGFGHYAGIVRAGGAKIAVHTDGVGTKVLIANRLKKYDTVGIDCVAMNANDIICIGAEPAAFVDYIAASRNDGRIFSQIMRGLARGAKQARVPIVGGETAVMPGMFAEKGFGFDLAGAIIGTVGKKGPILGRAVRAGDVIIGAYSSGLHSNGYTLARKALFPKYSLSERPGRVGRLGAALLEPTRIYVAPALEALRRCQVHGMAHITGGAFTKLPRLKAGVRYEIDALPKAPPIMGLIAEQGVSDAEMYRTFNMGVGMCVMAPPSQESGIRAAFKRHRIGSQVIGRVSRGRGVAVGRLRIA